MCEYISSCIWLLLNAGRGGEYFSEPLRRRKPIFLPHTCLPSVIFNILPFISFHRAHCQTCVGLWLYLNYKPLKSISRHDFPPPLPVLSSFPSLKPLLLQPYGLPYKGLLHFDHTTPCLPQGFFSNWECTFLYLFKLWDFPSVFNSPPSCVYTKLYILSFTWYSVQWEVVYNPAVKSVNSGAKMLGCESWIYHLKVIWPGIKYLTSVPQILHFVVC